MSHRHAAGDLAGLVALAAALDPSGGPCYVFPPSVVGLLALLGSYGPPGQYRVWRLLAHVLALFGATAATILLTGAPEPGMPWLLGGSAAVLGAGWATAGRLHRWTVAARCRATIGCSLPGPSGDVAGDSMR